MKKKFIPQQLPIFWIFFISLGFFQTLFLNAAVPEPVTVTEQPAPTGVPSSVEQAPTPFTAQIQSGAFTQQVAELTNLLKQADQLQAEGKPVDSVSFAQSVKNLFLSCPKDSSARNSLKAFLQKAQNSPVIDAETQQHIKEEMIPSLIADETKAQNDLQQKLQDLKNIPDFIQRIATLDQLMQQAAGVRLDSTTQGLFVQRIKDLYAAYPADPAALATLAAFLNKAQTSTILDGATQFYIKNTVLPKIFAAQNQATIQQQLKNLSLLPYEQQIDSIKNLLQQTQGQAINPATQQAFSQGIKQVFRCPRQLARNKLTDLLEQIKSRPTPAIDPKTQEQVTTVMLPSIALEEKIEAQPTNQEKDLVAELLDLKTIPDYNQQVDKLESIIDQAAEKQTAGVPIDPTTQELLVQRLRDLTVSCPANTTSIRNLNELLTKIQDNQSILTPTTQNEIKTTIIPNLASDLEKAQISEQVQETAPAPTPSAEEAQVVVLPDIQEKLENLDAIPNISERIASFGNIVQQATQEAQGQPIAPETQQLIAKQLHDLYEASPLDPQVLANLAYVTNTTLQVSAAQPNPIITPATQSYIQIKLIPTINQDQQIAQFTQELNAAMALPTTIARVAAISQVTDKYASLQTLESTKNFYAQALQTLFDERYASQVVVEKEVAKAAIEETPEKRTQKKAKKTKKTKKKKKTVKAKKTKKIKGVPQ